jgi:hypothetical protein
MRLPQTWCMQLGQPRNWQRLLLRRHALARSLLLWVRQAPVRRNLRQGGRQAPARSALLIQQGQTQPLLLGPAQARRPED